LNDAYFAKTAPKAARSATRRSVEEFFEDVLSLTLVTISNWLVGSHSHYNAADNISLVMVTGSGFDSADDESESVILLGRNVFTWSHS
jgi:hypothetical protein